MKGLIRISSNLGSNLYLRLLTTSNGKWRLPKTSSFFPGLQNLQRGLQMTWRLLASSSDISIGKSVLKIFFKSRFLIKTGDARTDYPTAGCFFWFICLDCPWSFKWFINYSFVKGFINIWISTKIDQIFIVCWYPIALIKNN